MLGLGGRLDEPSVTQDFCPFIRLDTTYYQVTVFSWGSGQAMDGRCFTKYNSVGKKVPVLGRKQKEGLLFLPAWLSVCTQEQKVKGVCRGLGQDGGECVDAVKMAVLRDGALICRPQPSQLRSLAITMQMS